MRQTETKYFDIQRKIVAVNTAESWSKIPHVVYTYKADVDEFLDTLAKLNRVRPANRRISVNTAIIKILTEAIKESPEINSHIEFSKNFGAGEIRQYENIDITMPMTFPNGKMMTVNLHDFDRKNIDDMIDYLLDLQRRMENTDIEHTMYEAAIDNTWQNLRKGKIINTACRLLGANFGKSKLKVMRGKEKKRYESIPSTERLTKHDIEQGTITISNVGAIYREGTGTSTLLDIIAPQVAAIAVDPIREDAGVIKDEHGKSTLAVKKVMPICIALDHRALDFGMIVPMLRKLDEIFADPSVMYSWVREYPEDTYFIKKSSIA